MNLSRLNKQLRLSNFECYEIENGALWLHQHFISAALAAAYLDVLIRDTRWVQPVIRMGGRQIPSPRLAAWHGDADAIYTYSGLKNTPVAWTPALAEIRDVLHSATGIRFNSVLLNFYRNGEDSMGWHRDNEPELGQNPVIASISFGETRRFRMQHVNRKQLHWATELESGSALVMAGQTQQYWRHCLPKSKSRNLSRVNLTFRQIH